MITDKILITLLNYRVKTTRKKITEKKMQSQPVMLITGLNNQGLRLNLVRYTV